MQSWIVVVSPDNWPFMFDGCSLKSKKGIKKRLSFIVGVINEQILIYCRKILVLFVRFAAFQFNLDEINTKIPRTNVVLYRVKLKKKK